MADRDNATAAQIHDSHSHLKTEHLPVAFHHRKQPGELLFLVVAVDDRLGPDAPECENDRCCY
jgi:hypothetical protein